MFSTADHCCESAFTFVLVRLDRSGNSRSQLARIAVTAPLAAVVRLLLKERHYPSLLRFLAPSNSITQLLDQPAVLKVLHQSLGAVAQTRNII